MGMASAPVDYGAKQVQEIVFRLYARNFFHGNLIAKIFRYFLIERNAVVQKLFKPPDGKVIGRNAGW